VIVIDVNLLVYAYDSTTPMHERARVWLEGVFSGTERVLIPWQSICGFIRVTTNANLPGKRLRLEEAVEIVDGWFALPNVHAIGPGPRHWDYFRTMLEGGKAIGALGSDAALAALTMEVGGVLDIADRGLQA